MKYLLILIVVAFSACNPEPEGGSKIEKYGDFVIKTIDSCEYIEYDNGFADQRVYSLTHKGNCKYCAERSTEHNLQGTKWMRIVGSSASEINSSDTVKGKLIMQKMFQ